MLRKLTQFDYLERESMDEVPDCMDRYDGDTRLLAGGTDLLVQLKQEDMKVKHLVNLKGIQGLDSIAQNKDGSSSIGALTPLRELETSPLIRQKYPVLRQAAVVMGSVQVRNRATVAGNLCNASPAADLAPALLILNSTIKLVIPTAPAIANAVCDAVGVDITTLPLSPEKLYWAMQKNRSAIEPRGRVLEEVSP